MKHTLTRREMLAATAAGVASATLPGGRLDASDENHLEPRYILASCMYGYTKLAEIMPEVQKSGSTAIDIWPKRHGDQREQLDEMGEQKFADLLREHDVALGCITQFKLGPFGLEDEMRLAERLGCHTMVTGAVGPKGLQGAELKAAVGKFIEQLKPHLAVAEETGVTIAIENHGNGLIETPDSMKWLAELYPSRQLGIALAPYHLPQDETLLSDLVRALGNRITVFYAWQYGMGCHKKLPKEQELLQLPGRGKLDFVPIVSALKKINYRRWTEVFMHPVPRGIPILQTAPQVTAEINRSRLYLEACMKKASRHDL